MRFTARTALMVGVLSLAASAAPVASARVGLDVRPNPDQQSTQAGLVVRPNPDQRSTQAGLVARPNPDQQSTQAGLVARPNPDQQSTQVGSVGPPILRVLRGSELAAINRAEAQRAAAFSYSPPAGARYSNAATDAYATSAHPVAAVAPTVKAPGAGFDYGAAAVGAGLAVAIIVLIAAGGLAVRRRGQPQFG